MVTNCKARVLSRQLCAAWLFELKVPNEETLKAFEATDKGEGLHKAKNAQDLFKQLGI